MMWAYTNAVMRLCCLLSASLLGLFLLIPMWSADMRFQVEMCRMTQMALYYQGIPRR
jgi:hypothetical protein